MHINLPIFSYLFGLFHHPPLITTFIILIPAVVHVRSFCSIYFFIDYEMKTICGHFQKKEIRSKHSKDKRVRVVVGQPERKTNRQTEAVKEQACGYCYHWLNVTIILIPFSLFGSHV